MEKVTDYSEIPYYQRLDIDSECLSNYYVYKLKLSTRTKHCLMSVNIEWLSELLNMCEKDLIQINGFGRTSLREVESIMQEVVNSYKDNNISISKNTYIIPTSLYNHIDNLVKGDCNDINTDQVNLEEFLFFDRYLDEVALIDTELRLKALAGDQELLCIVRMFSEYIIRTSKASELRLEIINTLSKAGDYRCRSKILPFIKSFDDVELKRIIKSIYPDMVIGEVNAYLNLALDYGIAKHRLKDLLHFVTFNLDRDFNLIYSNLIQDERAALVLQRRGCGESLSSIGTELGVTRERVRQIESKVIRKLLLWFDSYKFIQKTFALYGNAGFFNANELFELIHDNQSVFKIAFTRYIQEQDGYELDKQFNLIINKCEFDINVINRIIVTLPELFDEEEYKTLLNDFISDPNLFKVIDAYINEVYLKTGKVFHKKKLTLADMYKRVLFKYFPVGIRLSDSESMEKFREKMRYEFGDIVLPTNDHAISTRIIDNAMIFNRGTYISKDRVIIDNITELLNEIRRYIEDNKREIVLINSIFYEFKSRLIMAGINNRYYLHGILRETFSGEYLFNKDCILKNQTEGTISSEIINFIGKFDYPITQEKVREEFPGATDAIINRAVMTTDIVNMFGKYIHIDKLEIDRYIIEYIDKTMELIVSDSNVHHVNELYSLIECEKPSFWKQIYVEYPFSSFSVAEVLLSGKYQFKRPFFANIGVKINGKNELLRLEFENQEQISVYEMHELAKSYKLNFTSIYNLIELALESHYLLNKDILIKEESIVLSEADIIEIEIKIIESIRDDRVMLIRYLNCIPKLPNIGYNWNEWLLFSVIQKRSKKLEVKLTSAYYAKAYPVISLAGCMNNEKYRDINLEGVNETIHDISSVEDLLEDFLEIEF